MAQTHDGNPEKTTIADLDTVMISNSENNFTGAKWTGATIKSYAGTTPASSLTPGTQSIAHFDKVEALSTQAQFDAIFAIIAKETLYHSNGTPVDGTYTAFISRDGTYTMGTFYSILTSGTLTLDIKKNGSTITGLGSIAVTSTESINAPDSTTTFTTGDSIEITISSASTPVGFLLSADVTKSLS